MAVSFEWCKEQPPVLIMGELHLLELLESVAKQVDSSNLTIANLHVDNGATFSIVLGGGETVLTFTNGNGNPPYYASRGDSTDIEPVLTCYYLMSHHTEFPRRQVIRIEQGLAAAMEFLLTGLIPAAVEWEEI